MKRSGLAMLAAMLASAGPAYAQTALGDGNALGRDTRATPQRVDAGQAGNALDANLRVGSGGVNGLAAKTDFYSRNLIVTGDVAGGRGFRGSVGYLEQSEFMGQTGANDLHRWDAYSVASSPMAIRQGLDVFKATQEFGAVLYTRTYADASARDILTNQQPLDTRIAFDRFTADGMKMRRQADIIDVANTGDAMLRQDWRVQQRLPGDQTKSGNAAAGGAQAGIPAGAPVDAMLSSMGLSTYERQRLKQDVLAGRTSMNWVGQVFDEESLGDSASQADSHRLQPVLPAEYTSLLDNMRERAGMKAREPGTAHSLEGREDVRSETNSGANSGTSTGTGASSKPLTSDQRANPTDKKPDGAPVGTSDPTRLGGLSNPADDPLARDLAWLRHELAQSGPDAKRPSASARALPGAKTDGAGTKPTIGPDGKPIATTAGASNGEAAASDTESSASTSSSASRQDRGNRNAQDKPLNIDDVAMILKHGQHLGSLVPEDSGYIHDMMQLGAESMRAGEFFRAEDRFASVLRVIPGHPLALAGVANAQFGAGLSISAALSLRKLYAEHPEMIGTRFGPDVLPDPERIEVGLAAAQMRLRAAMAPDAGPQLAADRFDYGLLIAYVGFQQGKTDVVHQGLDAMIAARADDPLVRVLQLVWLPDGEAPAATPATQAPDSSAPAAPAPNAKPKAAGEFAPGM